MVNNCVNCTCGEFGSPESLGTKKCFKDFWIFNEFDPDQREIFRSIGVRKIIEKGQPVFRQGDPVNDIFLIKSGRIKLNKIHEDGTEITLDFRKAGDMIGEDLFSGKRTYPLSAWAMEDTVTCGFELDAFNKLVMRYPEIGLTVIQSMGQRLSSMTDRLESMSENNLESRLHGVLAGIAREHGKTVPEGVELNIPLTHEDLGFLVGAHRVSITKAIKSLADCGKIERNGKKITMAASFL